MPFRKQSPWDKVRKPLSTVAPGRATVRSGLLAAGTAAGVTAMSSAVSSYRKKKQER